MDKTRVDDMLIQMITPKITEIEKKFSDGEGLTPEDVSILLLKSQYNHINHLDDKLNEVTASVVMLENKFIGVEGKFEMLKTDLENKFEILEGKFEAFTAKVELKLEQSHTKMVITMTTLLSLFFGISQLLDFLK